MKNASMVGFAAAVTVTLVVLTADPPEGATVLIGPDGAPAWLSARDASPHGWNFADGVLEVKRSAGDIVSAERYEDVFLHLEWRSPEGGEGQRAANSGVKIMRRYEVQILGTLVGEEPKPNGAGAIYAHRAASKNVTRGPGEWQVYEIWFRAPRWEGETKTENARMSVRWNGVLVHDDVEVPRGTGGSPLPEKPGPDSILLQAHSSDAKGEVAFRNVWTFPLADAPDPRGPLEEAHSEKASTGAPAGGAER